MDKTQKSAHRFVLPDIEQILIPATKVTPEIIRTPASREASPTNPVVQTASPNSLQVGTHIARKSTPQWLLDEIASNTPFEPSSVVIIAPLSFSRKNSAVSETHEAVTAPLSSSRGNSVVIEDNLLNLFPKPPTFLPQSLTPKTSSEAIPTPISDSISPNPELTRNPTPETNNKLDLSPLLGSPPSPNLTLPIRKEEVGKVTHLTDDRSVPPVKQILSDPRDIRIQLAAIDAAYAKGARKQGLEVTTKSNMSSSLGGKLPQGGKGEKIQLTPPSMQHPIILEFKEGVKNLDQKDPCLAIAQRGLAALDQAQKQTFSDPFKDAAELVNLTQLNMKLQAELEIMDKQLKAAAGGSGGKGDTINRDECDKEKTDLQDQCNREKKDLVDELEKFKNKIVGLETTIGEKDKDIADLEDQYNREKKNLVSELEKSKNKMKGLETRVEEKVQDIAGLEDRCNREKNDLIEKLEKAKNKIASLETTVGEKDKNIAGLQDQCNRQKHELEKANKNAIEDRKTLMGHAFDRADVSRLTKDVTNLTQELNAEKAEKARLTAALAAATKSAPADEDLTLRERITNLDAEIAKCKRTVKRQADELKARGIVPARTATQEDLEKCEGENATLTSIVDRLNDKLAKPGMPNSVLNKEVARLQKELATCNDGAAEEERIYDRRINALAKERDGLLDEIEALRGATPDGKLKDCLNRRESLQVDVDSLGDELEDLERKRGTAERLARERKDELDALKASLAGQGLADCNANLNAERADNEGLTDLVDALQAQIVGLEADIARKPKISPSKNSKSKKKPSKGKSRSKNDGEDKKKELNDCNTALAREKREHERLKIRYEGQKDQNGKSDALIREYQTLMRTAELSFNLETSPNAPPPLGDLNPPRREQGRIPASSMEVQLAIGLAQIEFDHIVTQRGTHGFVQGDLKRAIELITEAREMLALMPGETTDDIRALHSVANWLNFRTLYYSDNLNAAAVALTEVAPYRVYLPLESSRNAYASWSGQDSLAPVPKTKEAYDRSSKQEQGNKAKGQKGLNLASHESFDST